jgi:hypothetical protein
MSQTKMHACSSLCRRGVLLSLFWAGIKRYFLMARPRNANTLAVKVARFYYYQGFTTERIAQELRLSRPKVSRLLTHARQAGLIEVGLAWGTTIDAISRHLTPKRCTHVDIVRLNGSGNVYSVNNFYIGDIYTRFALNYGERAHLFPVPASFDRRESKGAMWHERSIERLLDPAIRADLLVYSIGSPDARVPSHAYAGGIWTNRPPAPCCGRKVRTIRNRPPTTITPRARRQRSYGHTAGHGEPRPPQRDDYPLWP